MNLRTLILFLLPIYLPAQELSGVWTGYLQTQDSHLYYELALSEDAEKITGYSQITYLHDSIENVGIKTIKVTRKKNDLLIEDGKLVFDNYTTSSTRTKLIGALSLTIKGSEMILQGTFRTRSLDMRDKTSYEGKIYLRKTKIPESTKLIAKLDEMNLLNGLSFIHGKNAVHTSVKTKTTSLVPSKDMSADFRKIDEKKTVTDKPVIAAEGLSTRQIEILNNIYFTSDSLIISLFDNGTVDGDTVSVFLNNKMIVSKGRLSTEAIRVTVPANTLPDSLVLVMYAENLGAIPPNTGLLIIQDGIERYEIRFAGDLNKSSGILLKRRQ